MSVAAAWRSHFATYDDQVAFINANRRSNLLRCRQGISQRLPLATSSKAPTSALFSVKSLSPLDGDSRGKQRLDDIKSYYARVYNPSLALIKTSFSGGVGKCRAEDVAFRALLWPAVSVDDGVKGLQAVTKACSTIGSSYTGYSGSATEAARVNFPKWPALDGLLSVRTVVEYGRAILAASEPLELAVDPSGLDIVVRTGKEVLQTKSHVGVALDAVERLQDLLSIAVAQQAVVSGGLVLDELTTIVKNTIASGGSRETVPKGTSCESGGQSLDQYLQAMCVIHGNDVLRRNFLIYFLLNELGSPSKLDIEYRGGISQADRDILNSAFKDELPVRYNGARWMIDLSSGDQTGLSEPLPSYDELKDARMVHATQAEEEVWGLLRDCRSRIAELEAQSKLTEKQRRTMWATAIYLEAKH